MNTDTLGSIVCKTLHTNAGEAMGGALDTSPNGGFPNDGDRRLRARDILASHTHTILHADRSEDADTLTLARLVPRRAVVPDILSSDSNIG